MHGPRRAGSQSKRFLLHWLAPAVALADRCKRERERRGIERDRKRARVRAREMRSVNTFPLCQLIHILVSFRWATRLKAVCVASSTQTGKTGGKTARTLRSAGATLWWLEIISFSIYCTHYIYECVMLYCVFKKRCECRQAGRAGRDLWPGGRQSVCGSVSLQGTVRGRGGCAVEKLANFGAAKSCQCTRWETWPSQSQSRRWHAAMLSSFCAALQFST